MNTQKTMGLIAVLAGVASNLTAGTLASYATGDVLIGFRNASSGKSLVVDVGPVGTFTGYAANSRHLVSGFTTAQLSQLDASYGSISWSAFTYQADGTLFVTRENLNAVLYTQTAPIPRQSYGLQITTAGRMDSIVTGAANFLSTAGNTSTAVVEPYTTSSAYLSGVGYFGGLFGAYGTPTFNSTLTVSVEATTPSGFSALGQNSRADFYQVTPASSGQATMVGYFELNTNGSLSYVAQPVQTPVIQASTMARNGSSTGFNYKTGLYGTYTLRGTNAAGLAAARSTWPSISSLTGGDLKTHAANDTTTDPNRFYFISVQ